MERHRTALDRVEREVRLRARDEREQTGLREVLIGLAAAEPGLVVRAAKENGINARRLVAALSEWYPTEFALAPNAPANQLTPGIAALLQGVRETADPMSALAQQVFGGAQGALEQGTKGQPVADRTQCLLSALALV